MPKTFFDEMRWDGREWRPISSRLVRLFNEAFPEGPETLLTDLDMAALQREAEVAGRMREEHG